MVIEIFTCDTKVNARLCRKEYQQAQISNMIIVTQLHYKYMGINDMHSNSEL